MIFDRSRALPSLALAAVVASGCADFSRGPGGAAVDAGAGVEVGEDAAVSFAAAHAVLVSGCAGCHASGKEAGDTGLLFTGDVTGDLPSVLEFVDTGAPSSSRLVTKMAGNGHQGGTVFAPGTPEYLTVVAWIQGGALP
jgi:hypothetical protein